MKTLVLSMISIAATVAAMTACTSESDGIDDLTKDAPVEIKMSAGVLNIVTKSDGPINGLEEAVSDVVFLSQESTVGKGESIVWTTDNAIGTHQASIAKTSGTITFTEATKPYYSSDEEKYTYLIGYHPNSGVFSNGIATFNITGKQDIMYAAVVNGNKSTNKAAAEADRLLKPEFKHLLAQLKIEVKGDQAAATAWGQIKSIKVKEARTELKLDVKTGILSEGTATTQNINLVRDNETPIDIPATEKEFGYSMIFPRTAQYYLIIETDKVTSREVSINIPKDETAPARAENVTRAGEAYTITLTFSASEISAQAKVDEWTNVSGGTGTVD